jgi:hypothetical protein
VTVRLLLLLAMAALLGVAAGCSDDDPAALPPEAFARFEYGIRLSITCRRSTVRLTESMPPKTVSTPLDLARAWRAEAVRLDRELRSERFEGFQAVGAGDLLAASDSLKNALGAMTRALRTTGAERRKGLRETSEVVRSSGARMRDVGTRLDANACRRVDAWAESYVLPGIERVARAS